MGSRIHLPTHAPALHCKREGPRVGEGYELWEMFLHIAS